MNNLIMFLIELGLAVMFLLYLFSMLIVAILDEGIYIVTLKPNYLYCLLNGENSSKRKPISNFFFEKIDYFLLHLFLITLRFNFTRAILWYSTSSYVP